LGGTRDDLLRTALSIYKDIYIPSVVAASGVGYSYGITLTVPTIFTVSAQPLVFSSAQRSYIRAAHLDFDAARLNLATVKEQAEEDAAITYMALVNAQLLAEALNSQLNSASRLLTIAQKRDAAGIENSLNVDKCHRVYLQIKLNELQTVGDIASLQEHLGELTGLGLDGLIVSAESVPVLPPLDSLLARFRSQPLNSLAIMSANAVALGKMQRAEGDAKYNWRPQVTFSAQYGRISPINDVSSYHNLHGSYNVAFAGIQVQLPLVDRVRTDAARISAIDAVNAERQAQVSQVDCRTENRKLQRTIAELSAKSELAQVIGILLNTS
jgi:outer membrane protein TolC